MPRDTTKPVVAPTTASGEVLRSEAICSMPGVNMELASGLRTGECKYSLWTSGDEGELNRP